MKFIEKKRSFHKIKFIIYNLVLIYLNNNCLFIIYNQKNIFEKKILLNLKTLKICIKW